MDPAVSSLSAAVESTLKLSAEAPSQSGAIPDKVLVRAIGGAVEVERDVLMDIPFFSALVSDTSSFKSPFAEDGSLETEACRADCLPAIVSSVKTGSLRRLLTELPREVEVGTLLEQLDFLDLREKIFVFESIDELHKQLTDVHDVSADKYSRAISNRAGRKKARQAAAALCLTLPVLDLSEYKMRQRVFSWTMFVCGHSRTFPPRLRYHFRRTAQSVINFSGKQRTQLDRFKDESDSGTEEEADERTARFRFSDEESEGYESEYGGY